MALVFLFLYAPIFVLIVFSFNAGTSSSVWKGFSLSADVSRPAPARKGWTLGT